jgi:hypothetical protein
MHRNAEKKLEEIRISGISKEESTAKNAKA